MEPENRRRTGRAENGRFRKGVSGNPGGRPKIENAEELREALRQLTPKAVDTLREIMEDPDASASNRLAAANAILDRTFGKPSQSVDANLQTDYSIEQWLKEQRDRDVASQI